jgi:hypothetical protein
MADHNKSAATWNMTELYGCNMKATGCCSQRGCLKIFCVSSSWFSWYGYRFESHLSSFTSNIIIGEASRSHLDCVPRDKDVTLYLNRDCSESRRFNEHHSWCLWMITLLTSYCNIKEILPPHKLWSKALYKKMVLTAQDSSTSPRVGRPRVTSYRRYVGPCGTPFDHGGVGR